MKTCSVIAKICLLVTFSLLSACSKDTVVVLPDDDGKIGSVAVKRVWKQVEVNKAHEVTQLAGLVSTEILPMDKTEVESTFAETLAATPVPPVSFNLYFKEGGTQLMPESSPVIDQIFKEIKKRPVSEVTVIGHTDRVGTVQENDALALKRAQSVLKILVERGIKPEAIDAAGRGEREPLVATKDEAAEPRNRRTEISIR